VKVFFDTTVLVAAVLEDHEHFERSFAVLSAARRSSAFSAAHNLAEMYATLTRYPGKDRLSAEQALISVEKIAERLTIIALDGSEYVGAIRRFAANGIIGGMLYDGLIAACALKAGADVLYTWNAAHFRMLGEDVKRKARTP
jgi:predicted nucleic acid-binding protein